MARIGVIGGSGLYDIPEFTVKEKIAVKTPFGSPSDDYVLCEYNKKEIVFLPRHGRGHRISPSMINYRANIFGMKKLGVTKIISVSACGSLKKELKPLHFVIPLQFVDRTQQARKQTFFEKGIVAHIAFAEPVCKHFAQVVQKAAKKTKCTVHYGGTYVNMEGPQFSTFAESNLYRSWGMDIIGMTNMTEARLAREAELCYVTLAAVTDYDCWYKEEESVSIDMILDNLKKNVANSKEIVKQVVASLDPYNPCECHESLKYAIVTDPKVIPAQTRKELKPIIGKYC